VLSTIASRLTRLSEKPSSFMIQNDGRIESGSVSAAMMVARQSRRNQNTTRIASTAPSNRFSIAAS
jgi:hypothetical protein